MPLLAAVLPIFNEQSRIVKTLTYYASRLTCPLYIVDAGSSDQTLAICNDFTKIYTCGLFILHHKNSGTTESQEWIDWLLGEMPHNYFIFFSCSELISPQSLELFSRSISLGHDLVYVNRKSFSLGRDVSAVYSKPIDIAFGKYSYFPLCRFASRHALSSIPTYIHDNWLSSARSVNAYFAYDKSCFVSHYKNPDLTANLLKHISYAKEDAEKCPRLFIVVLRVFREIAYILYFALTFRLNANLLLELLMRLGYHANMAIFIIFNAYLRDKSMSAM